MVSTTGVKPYSEKIASAMSESDMFGQGRTFSSRFMSTVASMATTSKVERWGVSDSTARVSMT